jgi:hypothetical protein
VHRVDEPPARDVQAEAVAQQGGDLAVGQAIPLVEEHREGHGARPELRGRRAERLGGLERVAALHAPAAGRALADGHLKRSDDGPLDRQLFLVLRRHAHQAHGPLAVRARRRQRRRIGGVDVPRRLTMPAAAIGRAGPTARPPRAADPRPPRERRRLPIHGTPRRFELVFQLGVFAPEPLPLRFRAAQVLAQPLVVPAQFVNDLLRIPRRRRLLGRRHAEVMPNPRSPYKYEILNLAVTR